MTCIIGLEEDGRVYIGADSCTSNGGFDRDSVLDKKIFRKNGFIFAHTGTVRAKQIIEHLIDFPSPKTFDDNFVINKIAEPIRSKFKEIGYSEIKDNQESTEDGFIIAYKQSAYFIYSNYTVSRNKDGLITAGCGGRFARGAMLALKDLPPIERIERALEIASICSVAVESPFEIWETT